MKRDPERYTWRDKNIDVSQCLICKNSLNSDQCLAFPDGIPEVILDNRFDHRKPFKGDGGIRFEKVEA